MSEGTRTPDLNSERTYRFVESTKVYLYKVTFNLRTLIYHVPKDRKFKKVIKRYRKACEGMESPSISALSDRTAQETVLQFYRYTGLKKIADNAMERYSEYYDDLASRLSSLKKVKTFRKWKATSGKRKLKMYYDSKETYTVIRKDWMEDINRLFIARARVLGAKKDIIWKEYLKDPERFDEEINELIQKE